MYELTQQSSSPPPKEDFLLRLQNALAPYYTVASMIPTPMQSGAAAVIDIGEMQRYQMMAAAAYPSRIY